MRRPIGKALMAVAIVVLVTSSGTAKEGGSPAKEKAIRELHTRFVAAWNKHDAKTLVSFWAEDGDYVSGWGRMVKGRAEIERELAEVHAIFLHSAQLTSTVDAVRFIKPDVAVVDGSFEAVGVRIRHGATVLNTRGRYTWIVVKKGGKWWIVADRVFRIRVRSPKNQ